METDALVEAFRLLHTGDARLRAIEALMRELSPYEWRTVHSIAAARCFHFDIIGRLPVELVAQVFAYLDTSTPYRMQAVSRQWCHVLRSSDVLRKSLLSWYSTLDQDSADYRSLELKAKDVHAYRHGKPKHCFKIVSRAHNLNCAILVADTLVWSHSRVVHLFHIRTWKMYTLNGDARESIEHLFASEQIVGFTTASNICYVSDLEGCGKRKFRVPNSALFQSLACRERTVACAGAFEDHVLVYIWSYDSQQGRSFTIPHDAFPIPCAQSRITHKQGLALLLHPKDARITIFADGRCSHNRDERCVHADVKDEPKCTIWYSQFSYSGDRVYVSGITLHGDDSLWTTFQHLNNPFIPVDGLGTFKISVGNYRIRLMDTRWLQFDERLNKFTEPRPVAQKGRMWANHTLFWQNDTFFSSLEFTYDSRRDASSCILAHLGTSENPQHEPLILRAGTDTNPGGDTVLLNDKYIIRTFGYCYYILCYEDNAHYPKEDVAFFDIGSVELLDVQKMLPSS